MNKFKMLGASVFCAAVAMMNLTGCQEAPKKAESQNVVKVPNDITNDYLVSRKLEYESRVFQVKQALEFASKMVDGAERARIMEEAVASGNLCQKAANEYNVSVDLFSGEPNKTKLDIGRCTPEIKGVPQVDNKPATPPPAPKPEDTSIKVMREQIADLFAEAAKKTHGLDRQALIIKANALINECRALAVRKGLNGNECVPGQ